MNALKTERRLSASEFERRTGMDGYELINGQLARKTMGAFSSWIQCGLQKLLREFVDSHQLGYVFDSACGYACFPHNPAQVRTPDITYIRSGRLPGNVIPLGNISVAPDLVIEVVSHQDKAIQLDRKIRDFRLVGVPLIWIVNPDLREVRVIDSNAMQRTLFSGDILSGFPVLPDFQMNVDDIFPATESR